MSCKNQSMLATSTYTSRFDALGILDCRVIMFSGQIASISKAAQWFATCRIIIGAGIPTGSALPHGRIIEPNQITAATHASFFIIIHIITPTGNACLCIVGAAWGAGLRAIGLATTPRWSGKKSNNSKDSGEEHVQGFHGFFRLAVALCASLFQ